MRLDKRQPSTTLTGQFTLCDTVVFIFRIPSLDFPDRLGKNRIHSAILRSAPGTVSLLRLTDPFAPKCIKNPPKARVVFRFPLISHDVRILFNDRKKKRTTSPQRRPVNPSRRIPDACKRIWGFLFFRRRHRSNEKLEPGFRSLTDATVLIIPVPKTKFCTFITDTGSQSDQFFYTKSAFSDRGDAIPGFEYNIQVWFYVQFLEVRNLIYPESFGFGPLLLLF